MEQDWTCTGKLAQGSKCKINVIVQLSYLGALRDTTSNTAIFYFKMSPEYSQFRLINFNGLLATNLSYHSMKVEYNSHQKVLTATV